MRRSTSHCTGNTCEHFACPFAAGKLGIDGSNGRTNGTNGAIGKREQRLYVLPGLGVHQFSLLEDVGYTVTSFAMLLPAFAACITFLCHGAASLFLRHRALLLMAPLLIMLLQIWLLTSWLSSAEASLISWLLPLALPVRLHARASPRRSRACVC